MGKTNNSTGRIYRKFEWKTDSDQKGMIQSA